MDTNTILAWLAVGLSALVLIERAFGIYRVWRSGKIGDKKNVMELSESMERINNLAMQNKLELMEQIASQDARIATTEKRMKSVAFDVSYRVYVFDNRVERFTIRPASDEQITQPAP